MNLTGHGSESGTQKYKHQKKTSISSNCHSTHQHHFIFILLILLFINQLQGSVIEKSAVNQINSLQPVRPDKLNDTSSNSDHEVEGFSSDSVTPAQHDDIDEDDSSLTTSFPHDQHPLDAIHYAAVVSEAVRSGIREAKELYEKIEPDLYHKGRSLISAINKKTREFCSANVSVSLVSKLVLKMYAQ